MYSSFITRNSGLGMYIKLRQHLLKRSVVTMTKRCEEVRWAVRWVRVRPSGLDTRPPEERTRGRADRKAQRKKKRAGSCISGACVRAWAVRFGRRGLGSFASSLAPASSRCGEQLARSRPHDPNRVRNRHPLASMNSCQRVLSKRGEAPPPRRGPCTGGAGQGGRTDAPSPCGRPGGRTGPERGT